jgi:hypothetical protein
VANSVREVAGPGQVERDAGLRGGLGDNVVAHRPAGMQDAPSPHSTSAFPMIRDARITMPPEATPAPSWIPLFPLTRLSTFAP